MASVLACSFILCSIDPKLWCGERQLLQLLLSWFFSSRSKDTLSKFMCASSKRLICRVYWNLDTSWKSSCNPWQARTIARARFLRPLSAPLCLASTLLEARNTWNQRYPQLFAYFLWRGHTAPSQGTLVLSLSFRSHVSSRRSVLDVVSFDCYIFWRLFRIPNGR